MKRVLIAQSYFDGEREHCRGPYGFLLCDGVIERVLNASDLNQPLPPGYTSAETIEVEFVMPGLVEAHAHLFLEGGELDFAKRSAYLKASHEDMLLVAQDNIKASLQRGITLIRDAGDIHGINHRIREQQQAELFPHVRSPGRALRYEGRYGSFMAVAVDSEEGIRQALGEILKTADDLKVILTGIIDFDKGQVKGVPQFNAAELGLIQKLAKEAETLTFAHCSGKSGLDLAIEACVDSIEHGFFMEDHHLAAMAEKRIAWVPTLSPVQFQADNPHLADWSDVAVDHIKRILESHHRSILKAYEEGVVFIAGSDAGSYGVGHGSALINELLMYKQAGLPTEAVLKAATSTPRKAWGERDVTLRVGNPVEILCFAISPFSDIASLKSPVALLLGDERRGLAAD